MSTAAQLIEELKTNDIHIRLNGNRLKINAPLGVLTPLLINRIKDMKPAIMEEMQHLHDVYTAKYRHNRHKNSICLKK